MFASFEEKGKIFTQVIKKLPVKVIIQINSQTIHGNIHIRPEQRIKDEINGGEVFLAVTEAHIYNQAGKSIQETDFMLINREHIIWIVPVDEPKPAGE